MSAGQLAIYGGTRAVNARFKEKWKQVRMREVAALGWYVARGVNTMPSGAGPVARFERKFAKRTGARYVLLMNSGTAALHSAFFAVGVKPGDEVIVPPYTFYASAGPVLHLGGVPVFCDIDEATLTADPDDVESRITSRTRAICVVHVWGNPARLDRFVDIARRHGIALIEDCSHAHGATYQGRSVGTWGDIGCFSLQGNKPVSGGEAGVAITENAVSFDHMLALARRTDGDAPGCGNLRHIPTPYVAVTVDTDRHPFGSCRQGEGSDRFATGAARMRDPRTGG